MNTTSTPHENKLSDALAKHGIKHVQQFWDGHKHVDIYIECAKLNIEIDGIHHLTSPKQILSDFNREYWADKAGYYTLHIPNIVIDSEYFDQIVKAIVEVVADLSQKVKK